jgi:hypothetical protein
MLIVIKRELENNKLPPDSIISLIGIGFVFLTHDRKNACFYCFVNVNSFDNHRPLLIFLILLIYIFGFSFALPWQKYESLEVKDNVDRI